MSTFGFETTGDDVTAICSNAIRGKVVLITGPSCGSLGAAFAETISPHGPSLIILASRDTSKLEPVVAAIKSIAPTVATRVLKLDLASQEKIREAASEVNNYDDVPHIDVLINSSGIMAVPYSQTTDGIELQFGVNHLGHFLFTNLIINKLVSADGSRKSRVVNVSSNGHELSRVRFEDWNFEHGPYNRWYAYGQSKSANMLFSISLAARFANKGLISVSLHPGVIRTNLSSHLEEAAWPELAEIGRNLALTKFRSFNAKSQQQGVATYVFAAFHDSISMHVNGRYLEDSQVLDLEEYKCWGRDPTDAERLWKLSERLVGQEFRY
ncbi:short-chain dehydrogenase [Penicillium longicatenatum]|nr:short-chain dehydrogenase [Penicillium longicatenatum]